MGECIYRDYIEGLIPGENGYTSILVMIDILYYSGGKVFIRSGALLYSRVLKGREWYG